MNYTLVLAPDLQLDADAFVTAWNSDPQTKGIASATLAQGASKQFNTDYMQIALTVVEILAGGVAGNALYDLIKTFFFAQGVRRRTQIVELDPGDPQIGAKKGQSFETRSL
jgi:hypothetical protein